MKKTIPAARTIRLENGSQELPGEEIDAVMQHFGITEDAAVYMFERTLAAMIKHEGDEAQAQAAMTLAVIQDAAEGHKQAEEYLASFLRGTLPLWTEIYEKAEARGGDIEANVMAFLGPNRPMAQGVIGVVRAAKEGLSMKDLVQAIALATTGVPVEEILKQLG